MRHRNLILTFGAMGAVALLPLLGPTQAPVRAIEVSHAETTGAPAAVPTPAADPVVLPAVQQPDVPSVANPAPEQPAPPVPVTVAVVPAVAPLPWDGLPAYPVGQLGQPVPGGPFVICWEGHGNPLSSTGPTCPDGWVGHAPEHPVPVDIVIGSQLPH